MGISYKPLFRLLVDRNMTKTNLRTELGLSSATLAKLSKGGALSGSVIEKLCQYFHCQVQEVVEIILDEDETKLKSIKSAKQLKQKKSKGSRK
jgi:DNA-binding Xre family transcriptional regulator